MSENQWFEGKKYFWAWTNKSKQRGYFTRSSRLHTDVWESVNGPVPAGYHVHHRDGDVRNNDISNLECLPASTHIRHALPAGPKTFWEQRRKVRYNCKRCGKVFWSKATYAFWCSRRCYEVGMNERNG